MNGIILINKPKEYTSHDVVAKVKRILNIKKVGHTGTLDPNATGVLPLLLNEGTKLSKYLINHDKEYEVTLKLGIKTDTADGEGKVIEEKNVDWGRIFKIEDILNSFIGKQEQIPPMYSAIKHKGKKLYEYARNGQKVELEPRKIEIYNIELGKIKKEKNEIEFKVKCSKGTYIRSLCEDIANKLGTIGYMKELNRTIVGEFNIADSISIEQLENSSLEDIEKRVIKIQDVFIDNEKIILTEKQMQHFLNGVKITQKNKDGIYCIFNENNDFIGLGVVKENLLKRDIILATFS